MAIIVGVIVVVLFVLVVWWLCRDRLRLWEVVRGPVLVSAQAAAGRLRAAAGTFGAGRDAGTFKLLGFEFPLPAAHFGVLFVGLPGTGKTSETTEMVASLAPRLGGRQERIRLVIFDAKNEWPAKLHALLPPWVPVYQLCPLDAARGVRWAMGEDVRSPAEAFQFATGMTPDQANDPNGFFTRGSRNVLMDLTIALVLTARQRWRPRHLAALTRNRRLLAAVLRTHPLTRDTAAQLLRGKSGKDVLATVASFINLLFPAFAGWDRCDGSVSIRRFLRENAALVLGWDDGVSDALGPLYTFFLRMLIDQVLLNQDPSDRTFLFLDELGLLGRLEALARAAYRGRSSALCLAVGVQDLNTLYRVYGHHGAREVLASLQTKVFFRLGSRDTAEFAAGVLGKHEIRRWLRTSSTSGGAGGRSNTSSVQEQYADRSLVSPDELMALPLADPVGDRLMGYLTSPWTGPTGFEVPFLAAARAIPVDPGFVNYRRREPDDQLLAPFTAQDAADLGLPVTDELLAALTRRP